MKDPTPNSTIINTLRILARDIESEDGVANAALQQAAERFVELVEENKLLHERITELEAEKDDWPEEGNAEAAAKAWEGVDDADAWLASVRGTAEHDGKEVQA